MSAFKQEAHPYLTVSGDGFYPENLLKILLPIDKHVKIISVRFLKKKIFGHFIMALSCQIVLAGLKSKPRRGSLLFTLLEESK